MITVSPLNEVKGVRHAFFTREGGVSQGIYESLNCGPGSGDDAAAVAENRARAMEMLEQPADALATLYQVHSSRCVVVDKPFAPPKPPEADAMVTKTPGVALGILTADCAPVLFADGKAGVIGAAHAGWKGAKGGVLQSTLEAMMSLGASPADMVAVIGPCIAQRSYEVGPDFIDAFKDDKPHPDGRSTAEFFYPSPNEGHAFFDLSGYISVILYGLGIGEVDRLPCDTYREKGRFFSYRRATHLGEKDYGRMLSAVVLSE